MGISKLEIVFFQPLITSFYFFWLPLCSLTKAAASLNLAPWWWCAFCFCLLFIFSAFLTKICLGVVILYFNCLQVLSFLNLERDSFIDLERLSDPYLSHSFSSRILIIQKSELLTKPPLHFKHDYYLIPEKVHPILR